MRIREYKVDPVPASEICLSQVYVWEWPVRICHWLVAGAIVVLAFTGIYIGNPFIISPGPASANFTMGTMKAIHFYAAITFTLALIARVVWMFIGNKYARWDKFLPVAKIRRDGLLPTLKFYLFLGRKPPGFVGHNPLAGLTYTLVYALLFLQVLTGLAVYAASATDSWLSSFAFLAPLLGGLQTARWLHHIIMWLLLGFAAHHIYSAILMSQVEANATVESIVSGYKFVPKEDLVFSGYRFVDRKTQKGG